MHTARKWWLRSGPRPVPWHGFPPLSQLQPFTPVCSALSVFLQLQSVVQDFHSLKIVSFLLPLLPPPLSHLPSETLLCNLHSPAQLLASFVKRSFILVSSSRIYQSLASIKLLLSKLFSPPLPHSNQGRSCFSLCFCLPVKCMARCGHPINEKRRRKELQDFHE